ncbi:hypothetical protein V6O07_08285, partial [Arthrospira platensis SPKY2]
MGGLPQRISQDPIDYTLEARGNDRSGLDRLVNDSMSLVWTGFEPMQGDEKNGPDAVRQRLAQQLPKYEIPTPIVAQRTPGQIANGATSR